MKLKIAIVAMLVLSGGLPDSSLAQQPSKKMTPDEKLKVQNQDFTFFTGVNRDGECKNAPPEMPGITFPGKPAKYLSGFFVEKTGGRGARFKVPESAQAVIQYYYQVLSSGSWTAEKPEPGRNQVSASNQSMRVGVTVSAYETRGVPGCEVSFVYGTTP
jgi:hypothetical protein